METQKCSQCHCKPLSSRLQQQDAISQPRKHFKANYLSQDQLWDSDAVAKDCSSTKLGPNWKLAVDLDGCPVESLRGEVNANSGELLLQSGKWMKVVAVPPNVQLPQLKVALVPSKGLVQVKAPLLKSGELMWREQMWRNRAVPAWVPISIVMKDSQRSQLNKWCSPSLGERSEEELCVSSNLASTSNDTREEEKETEQEKGEQHGEQCGMQWIREDATGQLALILPINAQGFLPEEVRVRISSKQRTVSVEANMSKRGGMGSKESEEQQRTLSKMPLPVKSLRREFILPEWADVEHISFRADKSGEVLLKVPVLAHKENTVRADQLSDSETAPQQQQDKKWEKPQSF